LSGPPAARPRRTIVVTGTATEVGKTWCTARLLEHLCGRGVAVAARKPVQSFEPGEGPTDAEVLAAASGERPSEVCPEHRWYGVPVAPPMATELLGAPPVTSEELLGELAWPDGVEVGLVETVGGIRSPLSHDDDSAGFARRLRPDLVLLVADAGLGTINSVRLSVAAADGLPLLVHLNRFDPTDDLHRRNAEWLEHRDRTPVTTTITDLAAAVLADRG